MSPIRQGGGQAARDTTDPVEAQVIAPLRQARLEPDDLQVARLSTALDGALRGLPAPRARAARPVARRARWIAGAAAALALGAGAVGVLDAPPVRRSARPTAAPEPGRTAVPILHEAAAPSAVAPAPRPLVVPAGAREQGRIGERVRFTLVGPGELSAVAVDGGAEIDLARGRLLVDYEGNGVDLLRVRSPGAVTTVVGTLFAVEARGAASRVAVARGSVVVEGAGARLRQIATGRSWATDGPETEPIPGDVAADLDAHDRAGSPPPPAPATAPRPPPAHRARDAEAAYAAAEELMRAGATTAARRALLDLVAAHPGDTPAQTALLDLARLALTAGHPLEARRHLARLLATTRDPALIDLARQVERRIDAAAD
jgi:hypothetical protein